MKTFALKLLGIAFSLASATAFADVTYYVSPGGDGTDPTSGDLARAYAHPQDAVDAADGTPTVIKIATGTYTYKSVSQNVAVLNVNKNNVTVEALDGYGTVKIDGGTTAGSGTYNRRALTIPSTAANVLVRNLVFKNGMASASNGATGVLVQGGVLDHCDITGYQANKSNAVSIGGTATLRNCSVTMAKSMSLSSSQAATLLVISDSACLEDCIIGDIGLQIGTLGKFHQPISISGTPTFTRCTIRNVFCGSLSGTTGLGWGTKTGSVYASGGTFTDCVFTNNVVVGDGGGLYVDGAVTLSRCRFRDNRATGRKNDLYLGVNTAVVTDTAAEDLEGSCGNLGAWPDKEENGARYAIVVSNAVKAVRVGVEVPVRLDATSDVTPADYAWTFEDETVASGRSVTHTFATAGEHTVTCVVTLEDGASVTVTKEVLVVGPVCYVSKTGSNEAPYETPEKAARHPQDAIELRPARVEIDSGKYGLRGAMDVSILSVSYGDIEIVAKNGRSSVWLDAGTKQPDNGYLSRVVSVGDGISSIVFRDLCLTNGYSSYNCYCGKGTIIAYAGRFENCSINLSGFSRNGGGMIAKNAVLTNCLITSIKPFTSTGSADDVGLAVSGGAQLIDCEICDYKWCTSWTYNIPCITLAGAASLIRGCYFHDIEIGKSGSTLLGAAIYATGGTIENCTITDCKSWNKGGGLYIDGAGVVCRNNIIINNTAVNGGNDIGTATDYAMVSHTLASDLKTGENGNLQSASVLFKAGTRELDKDSQCVNAGENQDWMDGAHDRIGNPRIYDGTVDMGAYECQEKSESLVADFSVTSASSFGPPPLDIQVTANISGGGEGATYAWNWGDGTFLEMNATNGVVTHTYTNVGAYTITMTAAKGGLTTVYAITNGVAAVGEICYVSTNGAAIPPYDTWAKATSNIQDAVAYKPKTVLVSNGVYYVDHTDDDYGIRLTESIRLASVEGAEETIVRSRFSNTDYTYEAKKRLVTIEDAGASVEGFTFEKTFPPLVVASAGRLEGCVVRNPYQSYDSSLTSFSGTAAVTNCLFDGTGMDYNSVNSDGSIVALSGSASLASSIIRNYRFVYSRANDVRHSAVHMADSSVMRSCFVADTVITNSTKCLCNAAVVAVANATIENCTVRGSRMDCGRGAGLITQLSPKIGAVSGTCTVSARNVLLHDNWVKGADAEGVCDFLALAEPRAFESNLIGVGTLPETAKGCIVGEDPCFADDGSGYRITKDSPCYNKGTSVSWASRKGLATDIDGQERHCGPIDIGCWELQRPLGLRVLVR